MRSLAAIGAVTLVVAAGCGDGGLSATERDRLGERIAEAREAAGSHDANGVRRALSSFRNQVRAARRRGEITAADADRLLRGALQASRRVRVEITPEPTPKPAPTATAPAVTPPPQAPAPQLTAPPGNGKAKGHGKAKGKKKP